LPAQIIPDIGLDNTGVLLGLLALLVAGLVVLLFILLRLFRRRKAPGVDTAQPAQLASEAPVESAVVVEPETIAAPAVTTTPVLSRLFSAEGQPLEPDFAQAALPSTDIWAIPDGAADHAPAVPDLLAESQVRRHLDQVNQFVLLQYGALSEEPGRVELSWYTTTGPRTISIAPATAAAVDERELIINGIPFDASSSGVQKGIVAYLRGSDNRMGTEAV
jgi:hypothetical protein